MSIDNTTVILDDGSGTFWIQNVQAAENYYDGYFTQDDFKKHACTASSLEEAFILAHRIETELEEMEVWCEYGIKVWRPNQ